MNFPQEIEKPQSCNLKIGILNLQQRKIVFSIMMELMNFNYQVDFFPLGGRKKSTASAGTSEFSKRQDGKEQQAALRKNKAFMQLRREMDQKQRQQKKVRSNKK